MEIWPLPQSSLILFQNHLMANAISRKDAMASTEIYMKFWEQSYVARWVSVVVKIWLVPRGVPKVVLGHQMAYEIQKKMYDFY